MVKKARKRKATGDRDGSTDFNGRRLRIATLTIRLAVKEPSSPGLHPGQRLTTKLARLAVQEFLSSKVEDEAMITVYEPNEEPTDLTLNVAGHPIKITARMPRGKEKQIWW